METTRLATLGENIAPTIGLMLQVDAQWYASETFSAPLALMIIGSRLGSSGHPEAYSGAIAIALLSGFPSVTPESNKDMVVGW